MGIAYIRATIEYAITKGVNFEEETGGTQLCDPAAFGRWQAGRARTGGAVKTIPTKPANCEPKMTVALPRGRSDKL
jgi:hypothetical protein